VHELRLMLPPLSQSLKYEASDPLADRDRVNSPSGDLICVIDAKGPELPRAQPPPSLHKPVL